MVAALEAKKAASSSTGSPAQLAEVIQAVFQMNAVPTTPPRSDPEARERLSELKVAERSLNYLASKNLSNLNYSIQLARTLDREAALEADPLAHLDYAFTDEKRAIDLLEKAIQQAPGNGGLYEQRSIFLQRQVKISERQKLSSDLIAKMEIEETDGFRRALELSPKNNSPLWGAVYGLLDRRENDVAVEVAHTIMLLEPESTTAEVAYTVALAQVGDKDEAKRYLPPLLDKASQTELEALWHSFETSGNFEVRGQIADAAKKRFNQDLTVQPATPI